MRFKWLWKIDIQLDLWCNRKKALHISPDSGWNRCSWSICSYSSRRLQKLHSTPTARSERHKDSWRFNPKSPTEVRNPGLNNVRVKLEKWLQKVTAHIFLCEINQVLKINVVSVSSDVVINEKIKLVLYPVLEDECQDSCSQFQKEDDTQEHGELQKKKNIHTLR